MATLATLLEVVVQADTSNAQAGLMGLNQSIGQAGSNALGQASHFTRLGFLMTGMGLSAGLAAKAIGSFLMSGIKDMVSYEAAARKTWTQVEDSSTQAFETIKRIGLDVARTIPVPLETVQEGLYDIFSSMNVTIKEAEHLITQFAKAAVAGATDIGTVSNASIAIMNAWGMGANEVTKVLDMQFQTVKLGRIEYAELATTIGRAIPAARNAGASFSDLGGMIAFMTRNGLSAAQSATSAGRAFDLMTNPKFRDRMEAFGVSVVDAEGKFRPMVDIVEDLRGKFVELEPAQQTLKMLELGGEDAAAGLKGLGIEAKNADGSMKPLSEISEEINDRFRKMSESEVADKLKELGKGAGGVIQAMRFFNLAVRDADGDLRKFTEAIEESAGDMEEARKKMMGSQMAIQLLKNQFQIIRMEIVAGLGPALMVLAGILGKVSDWFSNLSDKTKENIGIALAITSAFLGVVGVLLTAAGAVNMTAGAFTLMGVNAARARTAAMLLYGSLGLIPIVIFAIIQNWDKLEPYFKRFVDFIQPMIDAVERFVSTVKKKWDELTKVFREEGWKEGLKALPKFFEDVLKAFKDINIKKFAGDLTDKFNEWVKSVDWGKVGATLGSLLGKAFGMLAGMGAEIAEGILKVMAGIDWFSVGARAAVFLGAFLMGAIQGVFSSGILGDIGGMILRNLGPIVETALILALAPPGLVGKLIAALSKIPIVGTMLAFFTAALRYVGLGLVGAARFLFLPLTSAISTVISIIGAHIAGKLLFLKNTIIKALSGAVLAAARAIAPVVMPLVGAITTALQGVFTLVQAAAALMFTPVGLAIMAAIGAGFLLWKYNDEIVAFFEPIEADIKRKALDLKAEFTTMMSDIKTAMSVGWDTVKTTVMEKLSGWKETIVTKFNEISAGIAEWFMSLPVIQWVTELWTRLTEAWNQGWTNFLGFVTGLFVGLIAGFVGLGLQIVQSVLNWVNETGVQIQAWGNNVWNSVTTAVTNIYNSVVEWFSKLPERISTFLENAKTTVLNKFNEMKEQAKLKAQELHDGVVDWFSKLPGRVSSFVETTKQNAINKFNEMKASAIARATELYNGVINWFSQLPGRVSSLISTVASNISSGFSNMVSTAISKGAALVNGFMIVLRALPGLISGMVGSLVASIGSWGAALIAKARSIGASIWNGFKQGLGIKSPSYLEKAMDHINEELIKKMHNLGPDAARTMARATAQITKAFAPIADMAVGATVNGNVNSSDVVSRALATANTVTQAATQNAPLIGEVHISSATPEQAYIDFDRKLVALNMRIGR